MGHPRALIAAIVAVLAALPLRGASNGDIPGAGPDVVSTVWGMWWFGESWTNEAWGGWSPLANAPHGLFGSVLSPTTAAVWNLFEGLGPGPATAITAWLTLVALCGACALLAHRAGARCWMTAALVPLAGHHLLYSLGEGSIVAIAFLPLPLGLAALLGRTWKDALALVVCTAWMALENPYLAPVLPACTLLVLKDRWRTHAPALFVGCLGILGPIVLFAGGAAPDYPREVAGTTLLGLQVVDMPWAGVAPWEWVWPRVQWTLDAESAREAFGGGYLGLSVLGLALWSRRWPWLALAGVGMWLAIGSAGLAFLGLNTVMDAIARPLTQPPRFLALAVVGLSVAVAFACERKPWLWGLLVLDALIIGGAGLKLPTTPVPSGDCAELRGYEGGVLAWPTDARMGEPGQAQLLQMVHGLPSPHRGIASWRLNQGPITEELRFHGFAWPAQRQPSSRWLREQGYRTVIAEAGEADALEAWWGEPFLECEALKVFVLPDSRRPRRPATPPPPP